MSKLTADKYRRYIKILKQARRLVKSERETYLCICLIDVEALGGCSYEDRNALTTWIQDQISPHYTYNTWLRTAGYDNGFMAVKAGRLAWIDAMIAQLKVWIKEEECKH